jgi:DNA polymerase III sliding clamp (beta) subunit (PCNA family)
LLKNSKSEQVDIQVTDEGLLILTGQSEFKLPCIPPEEFLWKEPTDIGAFEEYTISFLKFEICLSTCSTDVALGAFNQICIAPEGKYIFVYSSDGDAITKISTLIETVKDEYPCCLSRDFCDVILKLAAVDLNVWKEWVCAVSSDCKIYGRNLGAPTLDYEAEIKASMGKNPTFIPIPAELKEALGRARIVADAETNPTGLSLDEDNLILDTSTPLGNVSDLIKVKEHPVINVYLNAAILQRNLEGCTEFSINENCIITKGDRVLRIIGNME